MDDLYASATLVLGYARSRPALHGRIVERIGQRLELASRLERALDIGCGAGLSTAPLTAVARTCVGLEPSAAMLWRSGTVAPGAAFVSGRAEDLPFAAHSFDIATAAGSLNYADLGCATREAARVLRPGATLALYDFSPGRSFRGSDALDAWFGKFVERCPETGGGWQEITAPRLEKEARSLRLACFEPFEMELLYDAARYVDYAMTETRVAQAVREGESEEAIRAWCESSLEPVFAGETRAVVFRGYVAYLRA
jgi:ubiquinone/menaquinone biosynthesis C-methylase UbiE